MDDGTAPKVNSQEIVECGSRLPASEAERSPTITVIEGVQRGLDDFSAGRSRAFSQFAAEQRRKYNLPTD